MKRFSHLIAFSSIVCVGIAMSVPTLESSSMVFDIYQDRLDQITTVHAAEMQAEMGKAAYWANTSPTVVEQEISYRTIIDCEYPGYVLRNQEAIHMDDDVSGLKHFRCTLIDAIEIQYVELDYIEKSVEYAGLIFEQPIIVDYKINTYPNPFRDQFTLEIGDYDGEPYSFAIYDLTGKTLQYQAGLTDSRIDVSATSDWAPGIYIYRLINDSQSNVKSGKIIKNS